MAGLTLGLYLRRGGSRHSPFMYTWKAACPISSDTTNICPTEKPLGYSRPMLLPEFRAAIWIGILHVDGMFVMAYPMVANSDYSPLNEAFSYPLDSIRIGSPFFSRHRTTNF